MFQVGDVIYYPGHGVCTVKMIYSTRSSETEDPIFVLKPHKSASSLKRLVLRFKKSQQLGVHRIPPKEKIRQVWDVLEGRSDQSRQNHDGRLHAAKDQIYSGELTRVAQAARDLTNTQGLFFFGYRHRLLNEAKAMLREEISFVEKKPEDEVARLIEEKLNIAQEVSV